MSGIVLLDNQDSFVYNLVDALRAYDTTVYRNTVPADLVLSSSPDLIVLSPGPGYPAGAGCMMEVIRACQGRIPILGICLGYQALVEHFGGRVQPCGPVHGASISMVLSDVGLASPLFSGLSVDDVPGHPGRLVPVARYHSLGAVDLPAQLTALARTETDLGDVVMAAQSADGMSIGLQFHPESILTPGGPLILERCVELLVQKGRQ
ncbi:Anthranilate synthase component 2 [Corynebacterium capitovis DSM 44611]|uniref:glutamine amidotransferase-related protein n=1 Tax=Corynebacterium capitovis TaxID=131081 RepID=UPI00036D0E25|nr:gamma-glutamyl-gamma-aminobutyrate hydrolase family protein [Corynebacterium capitovis]WKD58414.1 Anthranilate synthase component 2 [Corynebacterium capitovis DSM 44611]